LFSESGIYNSTDFTPYQTQAAVDVNENDFASPQAMYGPFQFYGDNFTAELRLNLSDPTQSSSFNGIVVSGYGARANIAPQPFTPDNIVMIMDGTCGSTCSIFAELMKTQAGVRSGKS
jgi:hypothetical protein